MSICALQVANCKGFSSNLVKTFLSEINLTILLVKELNYICICLWEISPKDFDFWGPSSSIVLTFFLVNMIV